MALKVGARCRPQGRVNLFAEALARETPRESCAQLFATAATLRPDQAAGSLRMQVGDPDTCAMSQSQYNCS